MMKHWPAALGLAAAVLVLVTGAGLDTAAITVAVAALCYLGAAAFARPWVAWAGVLGFSVVVVAAEVLGAPWWAGCAAVAVALLVVGLIIKAPRRPLLTQAAGAFAYGLPAVLALSLSPVAGAVVAGLALAAHAGWDVVHHRRGTVVPRSLSEACMFLDLPLGLGVVVLALAAA